MSAYTKPAMRDRFWELTDHKDALNDELAPLRQERDAQRDKLRQPTEAYKAAKRAVVDVERPHMGEIDNEMAVLSRALGGKVGERPEAE